MSWHRDVYTRLMIDSFYHASRFDILRGQTRRRRFFKTSCHIKCKEAHLLCDTVAQCGRHIEVMYLFLRFIGRSFHRARLSDVGVSIHPSSVNNPRYMSSEVLLDGRECSVQPVCILFAHFLTRSVGSQASLQSNARVCAIFTLSSCGQRLVYGHGRGKTMYGEQTY